MIQATNAPIRFSEFCKENSIATDQIRWHCRGDASVKLSVRQSDIKELGYNLLSMAIVFALRDVGVDVDVTLRENNGDVDIIVEK